MICLKKTSFLMKYILKRSCFVGLLIVSFLAIFTTNNVNANEMSSISNNIELNSDSIEYWIEKSYSTDIYNNDPSSSRPYKPFPRSMWIEHRGYVGYIYVDAYYKSSTHYEVTYYGELRLGPFVPLRIDN